VSSTSRPERRASHHATRSGPAHMSMIEVLRARTTMFACAGVCRHFSEPHTKTESQSRITNHGFGNPPRTSQSHVPAFSFTGVRVVDGDARAPPFPNAHVAKTAVCTPTLLYPYDHATLAHIAASTAARLLCAEVRLDETIRRTIRLPTAQEAGKEAGPGVSPLNMHR
jgi:hypothetical protein